MTRMQVGRHRVLQQVSRYARREGAVDVLFARVHRQHDDRARPMVLSVNRLYRFEAAHAGELQIHERDVRVVATEEGDSLLARCRGGHDPHVRLPGDQRNQPLPYEPMVVDAKDPNLIGRYLLGISIVGASCDSRQSSSW